MPSQSSVFVMVFSNAFWHGNKTFPKCSSWNEIVPFLVVFHLLYSKYRSVKTFFHSCRYQNQVFSFVSHTCCSCCIFVACAAFVALTSSARVTKYTRLFKNVFKAFIVLNDVTNLMLHNHFFSYEKHLKCRWQNYLLK